MFYFSVEPLWNVIDGMLPLAKVGEIYSTEWLVSNCFHASFTLKSPDNYKYVSCRLISGKLALLKLGTVNSYSVTFDSAVVSIHTSLRWQEPWRPPTVTLLNVLSWVTVPSVSFNQVGTATYIFIHHLKIYALHVTPICRVYMMNIKVF